MGIIHRGQTVSMIYCLSDIFFVGHLDSLPNVIHHKNKFITTYLNKVYDYGATKNAVPYITFRMVQIWVLFCMSTFGIVDSFCNSSNNQSVASFDRFHSHSRSGVSSSHFRFGCTAIH